MVQVSGRVRVATTVSDFHGGLATFWSLNPSFLTSPDAQHPLNCNLNQTLDWFHSSRLTLTFVICLQDRKTLLSCRRVHFCCPLTIYRRLRSAQARGHHERPW